MSASEYFRQSSQAPFAVLHAFPHPTTLYGEPNRLNEWTVLKRLMNERKDSGSTTRFVKPHSVERPYYQEVVKELLKTTEGMANPKNRSLTQ